MAMAIGYNWLYTQVLHVWHQYGIFTYVVVIYGVNVGTYSIHEAYGI